MIWYDMFCVYHHFKRQKAEPRSYLWQKTPVDLRSKKPAQTKDIWYGVLISLMLASLQQSLSVSGLLVLPYCEIIGSAVIWDDMRARLYSIPDIHAPKAHLLDPHLLEQPPRKLGPAWAIPLQLIFQLSLSLSEISDLELVLRITETLFFFETYKECSEFSGVLGWQNANISKPLGVSSFKIFAWQSRSIPVSPRADTP